MHGMSSCPYPESLTDSLTHVYAKCDKPIIGISPKDLTHWTDLQYSFEFHQIMCVYLFRLRHFSGSHRRIVVRLPTFLWTFTAGDHVYPHVNLGLSPFGVGGGRIYPILLRPTHVCVYVYIYILFHFSFYTTLSLN